MIGSAVSLLCYSSFFRQQYEECDEQDYCFFLEDYLMLNSIDTENHTRSCERRGYCKTLVENLNGKILRKYGLTHKCGTFMTSEQTFADLCCCNYDWCNKLKVNELPIVVSGKMRKKEK
uniref:Activin_recp domain-containing protein n=1 Tax=Elaeophora elaphi TaxID=1147741 RepID=A0A0R3RWQ8_9BILA